MRQYLPPVAVPAPAAAAGATASQGAAATVVVATAPVTAPREIGGRKDGTEPTRFGDWEKKGRCIDF